MSSEPTIRQSMRLAKPQKKTRGLKANITTTINNNIIIDPSPSIPSNPIDSTTIHPEDEQISTSKTKPILVDTNYAVAKQIIMNAQLKHPPTIKVNARNINKLTIQCYDADDKKKLISKFTEQAIMFHSFAEPSEKNSIFVLSGLVDSSIDNVINQLKDKKIEPTRVSHLFEPVDNRPPMFLIQFPKTTIDLRTLQHQCKTIDLLTVQWKHFTKSERRTTQFH